MRHSLSYKQIEAWDSEGSEEVPWSFELAEELAKPGENDGKMMEK